ncbi:bifunctional 3-(3-hydroxy-phenyl)propionate/3-hydroxycinnamic acid hydroxylase [Corallococcus llansteffanensis]|uniref:Bifunctional 3-(3-hydroxy-phenyl)propionate/3-hydroxycinnamic acid hydroxylase n=1 Tax=Corallococcus llansteffanensis TaxID=2316731 RepID=A0A3A8QBG0_9BACT|nr:bifunctional 3-(3-hydroxy-phenyl)propionate/3-hydroxycinnamic acid hydroxylase [Corallococcus llansteffanensis]RKH65498.1 bifunctional 3-(3-hydroxy-phenyl)propionate/3-hydroxycinnamic acid hydroxylase [Corallococcus llansteffanensis]
MAPESVDVIVVGSGPVGAMAANLLGQYGLRTVVIEKETVPHTQSRAINADDEAQRIFQAAGLTGELGPGFHPCLKMSYVDDEMRVLAEVDFTKVERPNGHFIGSLFNQPRLEASLLRGLERFPHVALWRGHEVESFMQDEDGVSVRVKENATGRTTALRARYLLACDGAKSGIRRRLGLKLEGTTALAHALAISVETTSSAPDFTYYPCGPKIVGIVTRTAHDEIRFDTVVKPDQDLEYVRSPEYVRGIIAPYIDPDTVKVKSVNLYAYHSRMAEKWRVGRVFLLGDAAHLMPPFLGQGLCSGLRDAMNLTWKLAHVLGGAADASLLDTYEVERRPHAAEMMRLSDALGSMLASGGPLMARARNAFINLLYRMPVTGPFIREYKMKPNLFHAEGFLFGGKRGKSKQAAEGAYFPQPRVEHGEEGERPLDDVIGQRFAVLTRPGAPADVQQAAKALAEDIGGTWLSVAPAARSGVGRAGEVVDLEGKLGAWFAQHAADLVVLRPDRYVYGATNRAGVAQLHATLKQAVRPLTRRGSRVPRRISSLGA